MSHVCHHTHATNEWWADAKGAAVARAEASKRRDYRPGPGGRPVALVPLAAETGGRWGPAAELELARLAKAMVHRAQDDACAAADSSAVAAVLCRWRQELSCLLMRGNWGVISACAGGTAAGPGRVPRSRAAGELDRRRLTVRHVATASRRWPHAAQSVAAQAGPKIKFLFV